VSTESCENWETRLLLLIQVRALKIYAGHAAEIDCAMLDLILPEIYRREGAEP